MLKDDSCGKMEVEMEVGRQERSDTERRNKMGAETGFKLEDFLGAIKRTREDIYEKVEERERERERKREREKERERDGR
jgi:hypothetical protein